MLASQMSMRTRLKLQSVEVCEKEEVNKKSKGFQNQHISDLISNQGFIFMEMTRPKKSNQN